MAESGSEHYQFKSVHHRVYFLGLALLGGAVSAATYWKENHLISLLILASFVALVLIYELRVRGWGAVPIATFSISCYVLAWIIFQAVGPNLPVETDSEVYLVPGNKPTPDAPCNHNSQTIPPKGAIAFLLGSNEFYSSSSGESRIITLDGKPIVSMKKSDRGLLFDIEMFDLNKKLVAKLQNNKSILIPKNYSRKERSTDRSTLSLYDDYDKEILYVEYLNDRTILIRGVFTGPNGTTIVVDDNQILTSIGCLAHSETVGQTRHKGTPYLDTELADETTQPSPDAFP